MKMAHAKLFGTGEEMPSDFTAHDGLLQQLV
jgi:hypothetical protein